MSAILFKDEVIQKFKVAASWRFIGYSLIVYIGGAMGIFFTWYELCHESPTSYAYHKIAESIATFFVPIVGACVAEIMISPKIYNRIGFNIVSFLVAGASVGLLFWIYDLKSNYSFIPATLGIIVSVVFWIIAYADEEKFSEENFYNQMRGNYNKFKKGK